MSTAAFEYSAKMEFQFNIILFYLLSLQKESVFYSLGQGEVYYGSRFCMGQHIYIYI